MDIVDHVKMAIYYKIIIMELKHALLIFDAVQINISWDKSAWVMLKTVQVSKAQLVHAKYASKDITWILIVA